MKQIFRSIINIPKDSQPTIPLDELLKNYKAFIGSKVKPEDPSYIKMYHWIEDHHRSYKELPSIQYLNDKALKEGEETILSNLSDIVTQIPFIGSDYKAILRAKFEEQNNELFRDVLTKTWQIVSSGLKIKKNKEIKGINSAIDYFGSRARELRINLLNIKTDSQIKSDEDCKEVVSEYRKRRRDPLNKGMYTFFDRIDDVFRGIRPGDLFLIAAFVSQGKTTMAVNMAYHGIMQGLNGTYMSMEMSFKEMRDMFYVLHTSNPEWYSHPKYKNLAGKISYDKVSYGELTDLEQEFFEFCADDFGKREDFGELKLIQPSEALTPSSFEADIYDWDAELVERGRELDFAVIDYVGLMVQDKSERYGDFNVDLNSIIKKLKNVCLTFREGRGLRIITPFQVNREGWKEAVKNEGVYKLTALSNAHEAERTPDHVIALFMDEIMKKSRLMKIICLKHRRGAFFDPFDVQFDFNSRKIRDIILTKTDPGSDNIAINEIKLS